VVAGNESTAKYFVCGGNSDQNLLLIDGTPIYGTHHMLGLYSAFNSDAINSAKFYSGSMPATYGGRLSSVMDVSLREGNARKLSGELTLGIFASKYLLEGPIVKGKTSFIITGSNSLLDKMHVPVAGNVMTLSGINHSFTTVESKERYRFWDINAKINHQFSLRSKLFVSLYRSSDKYDSPYDLNVSYKYQFWNKSLSLRYNYIFSPGLSANIIFYNTQFGEETNYTMGLNDFAAISSGISEYSAQTTLHQTIAHHNLLYGFQYLRNSTMPQKMTVSELFVDTDSAVVRTISHSTNLFVSDDFAVTKHLMLTLGFRLDITFADSVQYLSPQPRIIGKYSFTDRFFAKVSYTRTAQNNQVLPSSDYLYVLDIHVPVSKQIRPATADEFVVGGGYELWNGISFSLNVFERRYRNLILNGDNPNMLFGNWQEAIVTGNGIARGAELYLKKVIGSTTGWLSYTRSKSVRQFDDINQGDPFLFDYDRPQSFSLALIQELGKHWNVGANGGYASGHPVSKPANYYYRAGGMIITQSYPKYYRTSGLYKLNLCVNYSFKARYIGYKCSVGVYNVTYARDYYIVSIGYNERSAIGLVGVIPYCRLGLSF